MSLLTLAVPAASSPMLEPIPGHDQACLADLEVGDSGVVGSITAGNELRLRMHALGIVPGRRVRVIRRAPFGGPIQIRSGHTCLLIRIDEARDIGLEPAR